MDWWRADLRNHFRASIESVIRQAGDLRLCDATGAGNILPNPVFPYKLTRSFGVYVQKAGQLPPKKFWLNYLIVEHPLINEPRAIELAFAKWLAETFPIALAFVHACQ